jgi:hypothetical protein
MSYLVANVPNVHCYVKKEYLYNFEKGEGELTPCYWVTVKSIKGRALTFEVFLYEYGALYDKLPISAFVWKEDYDKNNDLPLDHLQIWDAFSYYVSVIEKDFLTTMTCAVFMKDKKLYQGQYLFTVDSCHSNPNELNTTLSETASEHKSFNIIQLDNGQFAAQPNNRVRWYDQSLVPLEAQKPDFHYATKIYTVENSNKWSVGHTNQWAYKSKDEE